MIDLGLTQGGKEELALALLLWKYFKCQGKFDPDISLQSFKLAETLGVFKELEGLARKLPPFKIELMQ